MLCEGETRVTKPRLVRAWRREERNGEKRRVKPVGRALCANGRSFSISPHSPPSPPLLPSVHYLLHFSSLALPFSYSLSLYSSFTFSSSILPPSLSLSRLSPSSLLPLFPLLFSPFLSSATPLEPLRLAVIISMLASG